AGARAAVRGRRRGRQRAPGRLHRHAQGVRLPAGQGAERRADRQRAAPGRAAAVARRVRRAGRRARLDAVHRAPATCIRFDLISNVAEDAQAELAIDVFGPALVRKAERMLRSREDAVDVVHALFADLIPTWTPAVD